MWVGGFLIIGAGAHASIFIIGDMLHYYSRCSCCILQQVLNHRDVIIAHLIWVSIALGLHSFSLYIHNDTLQAFGRPEDIFHDNEISSIQLKPVFAGWDRWLVLYYMPEDLKTVFWMLYLYMCI
jgi:photosystem I P700 chlorophyll a apoprotein A1